jgi:hypothetical protein
LVAAAVAVVVDGGVAGLVGAVAGGEGHAGEGGGGVGVHWCWCCCWWCCCYCWLCFLLSFLFGGFFRLGLLCVCVVGVSLAVRAFCGGEGLTTNK